MGDRVEEYLNKVDTELAGLNKMERQEIINEINSHIYEAKNSGENIDDIIKKLGNPKKLARSYRNVYIIENKQFKIKDLLSSFTFFSWIAFSSMIVLTTLPILSIGFLLIGIFLIGLPILNILSITNISFQFFSKNLYGWAQMVIGQSLGLVFLSLAYYTWGGLKKYIKYVSTEYHRRRVTKVV